MIDFYSKGGAMKVLIAGCNGHVGREIVRKAVERKMQVRCFDLVPLMIAGVDTAALEVVTGDITDLDTVKKATRDIAAVIDVIGMKRETKTLTHETVEHGGMKNLVQAGRENNLQHILYTSVMGVEPDSPARTLAAKWNTEQTLIHSGIPYTIFRPSGYFVDFAEYFAPKIRDTGSFTVVGNGLTRIQPLDPADVAEAFLQSLGNEKAMNRIFKIAGPDIFTLEEVITLVSRVVGRRVKIKKIPFPVMNALFSVITLLTGKREGKDFLYRMSRNSVCSEQDMKEVREAFTIGFKRLQPWLRQRLGQE
jgi:uncharacterized protein YbjT (DUF2867 family)